MQNSSSISSLKTKRTFLVQAAMITMAMTAGLQAQAAALTEINFVEAVHNLGYINLYVGQHAVIFEKHGNVGFGVSLK